MRLARRRLLFATLSAAALAACSRKPPKVAAMPAGSTVLALGDSITAGAGATPETSYPAVLAKLTGWQIVNAGISGDTSAGALTRLPGLLQEHSPRLVLVSIGGNDFLRRMPPDQTRDNVRKICQLAAASGAQVLLVAIPAFNGVAAATGSLSDHAMFEELGQELKVPVHARGWSAVLSDPALRADPIHPNERGYAIFAQGLAKAVQDIGLFKPQ
jgi:acyl-CoA thioesterase I